MRAHADSSFVHLLVNERREGGASLPAHPRPALRAAFVPAAVARERERFTAYATRTMGGNLLGDLLQEEVRLRDRDRGDRRRRGPARPYASRLPFQLMLVPRRPAPASTTTARPARRCCTTRCCACAAGSAPRRR